MYYEALAKELLTIKVDLLRDPTQQKLSKMLRGEMFVLNYLNEHEGEVHPKELSEKLSVSTARIATLLGHMEEKNLITRFTDAADNRQIIVRLTDSGREVIDKARAELFRYVTKMLEDLGPDDANEFIRLQKKLHQNYLQTANAG